MPRLFAEQRGSKTSFGRIGRTASTSWPGIAVRRTASLPLAYARPSTSYLLLLLKDVDARDI